MRTSGTLRPRKSHAYESEDHAPEPGVMCSRAKAESEIYLPQKAKNQASTQD